MTLVTLDYSFRKSCFHQSVLQTSPQPSKKLPKFALVDQSYLPTLVPALVIVSLAILNCNIFLYLRQPHFTQSLPKLHLT
jgi:hypothetical protein